MSVTYYQVLGVGKDASLEEVKQAYHKIMRQHHPDIHQQQDDPLVRIVNDAYHMLNDLVRRQNYNQGLVSNDHDIEKTPDAPHDYGYHPRHKGSTEVDDILEACLKNAFRPIPLWQYPFSFVWQLFRLVFCF